MTPIDRRTFLHASAATLAAGLATSAKAQSPPTPGWKKAFMLGDASAGQVMPHFQLLKEAGFQGVELLSPNKFDRDEVLKARDETGLAIHGISGSVHWREPLSSPKPAVVERGLEAIRKSIEDCKAYGGTTVLLVPGIVTPEVSHREVYARSQAAIKTILPEAEKAGIVIAIEEVWNRFLLSAPEFARYIDEFNSPWVKAYFDVGNIVEYGYPQEWIRELGPRIAKVHIKEYARQKRFDYPLGDGKQIDWKAVRKAFEDVGYHGWITAEVGFGNLEAMKDVVKRMDAIFGS